MDTAVRPSSPPQLGALFHKVKQTPPALLARDAFREIKTAFRLLSSLRRGMSARLLLTRPDPVRVRRYTVPNDAGLNTLPAFMAWLGVDGRPPEGADSIYLAPAGWAASALAHIQAGFPPESGLKISKSVGDLASPYMTMRSGRWLQRRLSGPHLLQVRTFEHLHARGIGPELHGVIEIVDGRGAIRVGYVVEHIVGGQPTPEEFRTMVARLQELCTREGTALVSGSGWKGRDFQLPDGNGNAIRSAVDGQVKYIDVHSFRVFA